MRLLAIGLVTVCTVTQMNPAGAQNFDERFSIVPKANASEPDAEHQPSRKPNPLASRKPNPSMKPSRDLARKIARPLDPLSDASPQGPHTILIVG
jgi:hypothetical protein